MTRPILALCSLLIISTAAAAQSSTSDPVAEHLQSLAQRNPVQFYIEHIERLELSPEQVAELRSIGERIRARNAVLVSDDSLRAVMAREGEPGVAGAGGDPGDRPGARPRIVALRRVTVRVLANLREGSEAADRVLTPAQRARAGELRSRPVR